MSGPDGGSSAAGEGPALGGSKLIEKLLQYSAGARRVGADVLRGDLDGGAEPALRELDGDASTAPARAVRAPGEGPLRVAVGDLDLDRLRSSHEPRHPRLHAGEVVGELPELRGRLHEGALRLRLHLGRASTSQGRLLPGLRRLQPRTGLLDLHGHGARGGELAPALVEGDRAESGLVLDLLVLGRLALVIDLDG